MPSKEQKLRVGDKVRLYGSIGTGEVRQVCGPDRVVVYWPDERRGRDFSLEWNEHLAKVR